MKALFDLQGKVALVTGGAQGLGRMIAEALLQAGAKVYITTRKAEICAQAIRELSKLGSCDGFTADLTTPEAAVAVANEFKNREPRLHILVNNAGRTWGAPLESFPDKAWPGIMAVNVQGPFTLVRELLPRLKAAASSEDPARVINIGSLLGDSIEPLQAYSYAASKAALHQLSRVLAAELASQHITVNVIAPGFFPTQMTAHIRSDDAETRRYLARIPLGRLGEPDDIAGTCVYLASRAGRYVTGDTLFLDGGMHGCR